MITFSNQYFSETNWIRSMPKEYLCRRGSIVSTLRADTVLPSQQQINHSLIKRESFLTKYTDPVPVVQKYPCCHQTHNSIQSLMRFKPELSEFRLLRKHDPSSVRPPWAFYVYTRSFGTFRKCCSHRGWTVEVIPELFLDSQLIV